MITVTIWRPIDQVLQIVMGDAEMKRSNSLRVFR